MQIFGHYHGEPHFYKNQKCKKQTHIWGLNLVRDHPNQGKNIEH